jgi:dolichol-phosphate mannosyltransferase
MAEKQLLSIVVPAFNEVTVLDAFYKRLRQVLDALPSYSHEIIFVDDGSTDGTHQKLLHLAYTDPDVKVIKFSKNFGHQIAISAGMDFAKGAAVVVIDADLQDPPEVIAQFVEKWQAGYDVIYGIREKRYGERWMKLLTATVFYRLLRKLVNLDIPLDTGDFRLMSRRVVMHFNQFKERDRFIRGLVSWLGFKQAGISYMRDKRYAGETKFPYSKMFKFALDGITSFSSAPLKMATWMGYISSFIALLYGSSIFIQKALGYTVQGWATITVGIFFLGGVQLICIGILGEYLGRIFNEVKQRPLYIVEDVYGFNSNSADEALPIVSTIPNVLFR